MDTKTLVVGQEVYMHSGVYGIKGRVVRVAPTGVEVQTVMQSNITALGELLRFDNEGKQCDGSGTFECGPWELDEIPSTGS